MARHQEMTLRRVRWTRRVGALLARIDDTGPATLRWWRRKVVEGAWWCCGGFVGRRMVIAVVVRERSGPRYARELNIVAAAGGLPGVDLTATVLGAMEHLARRAGYDALTFETRRPGLIRRTALLGYTLGEIVMEKRL